MADPATIALIGTVVGAVSSIQQGRSQSQAANAQATVLQQQAVREREIAEQEGEDFRRRVRQLEGTSSARLGAAGVTPGGSAALVAEDLAAEAELQALRIKNSGDVRSARLQSEAALERFGGKVAKRAGFTRAGASLLSGLGSVNFGGGSTPSIATDARGPR